MADWQKFKLQVPGKNYLEKVRGVLETLMVYLEVLRAILETIKAFLIDFGNPIAVLVKALIRLIMQIFESLKQTGLYLYLDVPNPLADPNFNANLGGSAAFMTRFRSSLYDTKDPNRPQPVPLFNQAGFVILMVDASSVVRMIQLINMLLRFFGKEFSSPRYAAPTNARVLAVGDNGDPILSVAKIFSTDIQAVVLEWGPPTSQETPDPGFRDIVSNMASEFVPPSFLIEKSVIDPSAEIDYVTATTENMSAGVVTYLRETGFERNGKIVTRKERLVDAHGEAFVKFQEYYVVSATESPATFWTGQLGKFRWIDRQVEKDTTYYYRIRAFSGVLNHNTITHWINLDNTIKFSPANPATFTWPGVGKDEPIMGNPTAMFRIRLPKSYGTFDVPESLFRLFLTAFSLDFHRPSIVTRVPETAVKNQTQTITRPIFDALGAPVAPTQVTDIGLGALVNYAGILATFSSVPLVGLVSNATNLKGYQASVVTDLFPEMPWQIFMVRCAARRMANMIASAMLQVGSSAVDGYRDAMAGPFPGGPITTEGVFKGKNSLNDCLYALTDVTEDPANPGYQTQIAYQQALTYGAAYSDASFRRNVLSMINQIKDFSLGGVPPDWQSISLFHLIPWSAKILYQILAAIQALLDAFNGIIAEIKAFIDLLLRKITALERFIAFIIKLMEYILTLDVSCYCLNVSGITQGLPELMSVIDNASAGPNAPPTSPGGYSAGVVLGYVAPSIAGYKKAFDMIF